MFVAPGSEGVGDELLEKHVERGTDTVGDKDVGGALPQTQVTNSAETFAFRSVATEKEVSAPVTTEPSQSGIKLCPDIWYFLIELL